MPYYGRMRRSYGRGRRRRQPKMYARRTIGGQGQYQVRRAKALAATIIQEGKSNKYEDGNEDETYTFHATESTNAQIELGVWKRFKQASDGFGYNLIDVGGPGSGIGTREGRRIIVKKIDARIRLNLPKIAGTLDQVRPFFFEVVMLLDKQANGDIPPPTWYQTNGVNCHTSIASLGRFEILKRKKFYTNGDNSFWNNSSLSTLCIGPKALRFTMKKAWKRGLKVNFNSSASAGGSFAATVDHSVTLWLCIGGDAVVIGENMVMGCTWRTTFQDSA